MVERMYSERKSSMKKLTLLISLVTFFVLSAVPAVAQEAGLTSGATTDQYDPIIAVQDAADQAVRDIVNKGEDDDGAEAYAAALNAAREAGADQDTAEVVATEAVAEVSEKPDITVLPDTGGVSLLAVGGAVLVGGGLLTRRIFY